MKKIIKKCTKAIKNFFYALIDSGIVKIKTANNSYIKIFRLFGRNFINYNKVKSSNDNIEMYFKINREPDYRCLKCIQSWINIAHEMDRNFYFICDNNKLRYNVIRKCVFSNTNIKFIKSRGLKLNNLSKNLYTGHWKAATKAHIKPFLCAKKKQKKLFWNIDADDTIICADPSKVSKVLKEVENYSIKNKTSAISLDMWRSKSQGVHWSLGILLINDNVNFLDYFSKCNSLEWTKEFVKFDKIFNLDWYMTYLKNTENLKIETFYIENCYFVHNGDFIYQPILADIRFWKEGKCYYPILLNVFNLDNLGCLDTLDCIKFDVGIKEKESLLFLIRETLLSGNYALWAKNLLNKEKLIESN